MGKWGKIGAVAAVAVVVAVVGSAKYCSNRAQQYFTQDLQQLPVLRTLPVPVTLESVDYRSGFFSSSAKTRIVVAGEAVAMLKHDIAHGPSPGMTVVTTIDTEDEASKLLAMSVPAEIFPLQELKIYSVAGLSGVNNTLILPALSYEGRHESLQIDAMRLAVASDFKLESLNGKFVLPKLDFKAASSAASFENLQVAFDTEKVQGVYIGKTRSSLANFKFTDEETVTLGLQRLDLEGRDGLSSGRYQYTGSATVKGLLIQGKEFESLRADLVMEDIEALELLQLLSNVEALVRGERAYKDKVEQAFNQLFSGSPKIKLERMLVKTAEGLVEMSASAGLLNAPVPENSAQIDKNVEEHGTAEFNFASPKKALFTVLWAVQALDRYGPEKMSEHRQERITRNVTRDLEQIVEEGLLVEDGERYTASMSYSQGTADINGKDPMEASRSRAAEAMALSDLRNARTGCKAYFADHNRYPRDKDELLGLGWIQLSDGVQLEYSGAEDQQSFTLSTYHEQGKAVYTMTSDSFKIEKNPR